MALQNHPNLYTGGSAVFDSSPTVDTYARLQQRREAEEKARNEALNKYFDEALRNVNAAGIRPVHQVGIKKEVDDAMNYWYQNKDKIMRGGLEKAEFDRKIQNAKFNIEKAKIRDKTFFQIGEAYAKGQLKVDEDDMKRVLTPLEKSIYDPTSYKEDGVTDYGWQDLTANLPEYDPNKGFESWVKGLKGEKISHDELAKLDPQEGVVKTPFTVKLSPKMVETVITRAKDEYNSSREARSYWKKQFDKISEEELKDLEKYFKKYVDGRQIKTPDGTVLDLSKIETAEEYAMAKAAKQAEGLEIEKGFDKGLDRKLATERSAVNIMMNKSGGSGIPIITGNEFDRIPIPKKTWLNSGNRVKPEEVPSSTKAILKSAGIDVEGMDYFEIVVDGDKIQAVTPYWKDKEGKLHKEGVITRQDMENAQLKYNTEAQKGQQPVFGDNQNERLPKQIDKTRMNNRRRYKGLDKNGNPIFE